jgi:hypothetical protein
VIVLDYTEINELSDDLLICKALWQHDWAKNPTPKQIDGAVARLAHRMVCLRCKRCRRERYDYLGLHGQRIGRYYRNPVNYPKTKRLTNTALWGEMIERSLLVSTYNGDDD